MTDPEIEYIVATPDDITSVVLLHKRIFLNNFTTLLGSKFLSKYYLIFLNQPFSFLIAKKNNQLVGFIVGVTEYKVLAKYLKSNAHTFIWPILQSAVNLKLIPHVFKRTFNFIIKNRVNGIPLDLNRYHEITSLAIDDKYQGLGIGKNLLKSHVELVSSNKEIPGVFITTDAFDNQSTINFYLKRGFVIKYTYNQTKEREMHVMVKEFI